MLSVRRTKPAVTPLRRKGFRAFVNETKCLRAGSINRLEALKSKAAVVSSPKILWNETDGKWHKKEGRIFAAGIIHLFPKLLDQTLLIIVL